ncbi:MAG: SDR family oxidoreductase [Actinomycetota bacterium]|jgi:NAD(P)-dependent dehydrogenase (short-subunit alcohol dehydrogenase family)|nr:SDR family oxidoreductase [Actinomycetota bacterium]
MGATGTGRLAGKTVVVTGAASGIGAAFAQRFVAEGATCLLADVQDEMGEALARSLGDNAVFHHVDVTREDHVADVVDTACRRFGTLDAMVNNAGLLGATGPIATTPAEDWHRTLAVLLTGVFFGTKHAARVMAPRRAGAILNVASTAGVQGGLGPHAYTAAKHGVVGLTQSVATELRFVGVRANCLAPGAVATPLTALAVTGDPAAVDQVAASMARRSPTGRPPLPDDLAGAATFLISDEAWYINGSVLVADGANEVLQSRAHRQYHDSPPT